jgi:phosphatidylinositol alpha-mannosyltransferase
MRVGFVLDESLDGTDGVQQYVLRVSDWLRSQGHEVHYLVGETTRTDVSNIHSMSKNLHVRFNGNRLSTPLPASRARLQKTLYELQLDILHVQAPYSPFMAGRIMHLAPKNTTVVGTFHILPYSRFASFASYGLGLLNKLSARRFDAMMAVSVPAQTFAKSHYGLTSIVVPNCFDYSLFSAGTHKSKQKTIVYLGRLVERKGPLELVRAVAYLHKSGQWPEGWQVVIGGKGQLKEGLVSYISQYKLEDIVSLYGFVAEESKADFLAQADIAVFPSTAGESFGISLLEAFAATRGVVLAGDNPGYRSVMEGFEAQLFNPKDTEGFAALLSDWMKNAPGREHIATTQREYVKRFDACVVGAQIVAVYDKALQNRRSSWHN